MAEEIGHRLRAARKAKGLSVATMAERLEITVGAIRHHENGTRPPSARQIALYSKAYAVSTDWIILGRGRGPGDKGADIIDIFDHIPERDRPHALEVMRTFRAKGDKG
jgi:transcriptional regulator with XRE-family HTH domain